MGPARGWALHGWPAGLPGTPRSASHARGITTTKAPPNPQHHPHPPLPPPPQAVRERLARRAHLTARCRCVECLVDLSASEWKLAYTLLLALVHVPALLWHLAVRLAPLFCAPPA